LNNRILAIIIGGGVSALGAFLVLTFLPIIPPSEKYAISVDPIIVRDDMGTEIHVALKNTGIYALTNVTVMYGGATKPDVIPILNPGDKISLSPPQGGSLNQVRVTTNEGIDVIQPYRTPASAPFVGNSGYGG
jgi:hypothetical protein